jgi:hypothetical protein
MDRCAHHHHSPRLVAVPPDSVTGGPVGVCGRARVERLDHAGVGARVTDPDTERLTCSGAQAGSLIAYPGASVSVSSIQHSDSKRKRYAVIGKRLAPFSSRSF